MKICQLGRPSSQNTDLSVEYITEDNNTSSITVDHNTSLNVTILGNSRAKKYILL